MISLSADQSVLNRTTLNVFTVNCDVKQDTRSEKPKNHKSQNKRWLTQLCLFQTLTCAWCRAREKSEPLHVLFLARAIHIRSTHYIDRKSPFKKGKENHKMLPRVVIMFFLYFLGELIAWWIWHHRATVQLIQQSEIWWQWKDREPELVEVVKWRSRSTSNCIWEVDCKSGHKSSINRQPSIYCLVLSARTVLSPQMATLYIRSALIRMLNGQGYDMASLHSIVYRRVQRSVDLDLKHHNFESSPSERQVIRHIFTLLPYEPFNHDLFGSNSMHGSGKLIISMSA